MAEKEKNYMQAMRDNSQLFGMNDVFVEGLYEDYLANPSSVSAGWRAYFDALQSLPGAAHEVPHSPIQRAFAALPKQPAVAAAPEAAPERKQVAVLQLINA